MSSERNGRNTLSGETLLHQTLDEKRLPCDFACAVIVRTNTPAGRDALPNYASTSTGLHALSRMKGEYECRIGIAERFDAVLPVDEKWSHTLHLDDCSVRTVPEHGAALGGKRVIPHM